MTHQNINGISIPDISILLEKHGEKKVMDMVSAGITNIHELFNFLDAEVDPEIAVSILEM